MKDVFTLELPALDEEFAKKLGQESMEKLRALLTDNLLREAEQKESQRVGVAILEQLMTLSEFDELPEILINSEKQKMFHELKHDLEQRGVSMEQYLKDLKKTEEQIFADFAEQAAKRAKAALISRQVALENGIKAEPAEIEEEIKLIKASYGDDKNIEENLQRPEVLDTIATMIQNRAVMKWLKEKIIA